MEEFFLLFARDKNGMLYDTYNARLTSDIELYCTQCRNRIGYNKNPAIDNFKQQNFFKHAAIDGKHISLCEDRYLDEAIKDIIHSILSSEVSIYVSPIFTPGLILAPDKIFAPFKAMISRDDLLGSQRVDFRWTSSKGKCMGLVFIDHSEVIENKVYDLSDSKAFIAEINLAILKSKLRSKLKSNDGLEFGLINTIKRILINKNIFSRWVSWEGKQANLRISPAFFRTITPYGYDCYLNIISLEGFFYYENEGVERNIKYILKMTGRELDYQIKEIIYQFSLVRESFADTFYVAIYEKESVLLDYVQNSVPVNDNTFSQIKAACLRLIHIYESAMRGLSIIN
ncbi:hypothetical protein [Klebsiella pneumoniae]|uniref:hypothetical protein n=1 Tax=Klebsiella pneumoniae TaxID=573 RepID=UPI00259E2501|nr:hypothetical protein [Klebsiella pneumoniae]HBV4082262.1 hypothetical protein [Klebsiella quasipneumoniae]HBW7670319.1 hypothetical protein [Klebsiella pneumoniae]